MLETFTITAAARLLEKDRETLVRALRRVPPDAVVKTKGRDRDQWRMATIIAALDGKPHHSDDGPVINQDWTAPKNWRSTLIADALVEYNKAFAQMKAIAGTKQRRAYAVEKLAPLIDHADKNFMTWETGNPAPGKFRNDGDSVSARVAALWSQQMEAVGNACGWTSDECRKFLHDQFCEMH